jgi:hypothetical protein
MRYAGADSRHTPGALTAHQIAATHAHSEQFEHILEVDAGSLNGNFDLAWTGRAPLSRFEFEPFQCSGQRWHQPPSRGQCFRGISFAATRHMN